MLMSDVSEPVRKELAKQLDFAQGKNWEILCEALGFSANDKHWIKNLTANAGIGSCTLKFFEVFGNELKVEDVLKALEQIDHKPCLHILAEYTLIASARNGAHGGRVASYQVRHVASNEPVIDSDSLQSFPSKNTTDKYIRVRHDVVDSRHIPDDCAERQIDTKMVNPRVTEEFQHAVAAKAESDQIEPRLHTLSPKQQLLLRHDADLRHRKKVNLAGQIDASSPIPKDEAACPAQVFLRLQNDSQHNLGTEYNGIEQTQKINPQVPVIPLNLTKNLHDSPDFSHQYKMKVLYEKSVECSTSDHLIRNDSSRSFTDHLDDYNSDEDFSNSENAAVWNQVKNIGHELTANVSTSGGPELVGRGFGTSSCQSTTSLIDSDTYSLQGNVNISSMVQSSESLTGDYDSRFINSGMRECPVPLAIGLARTTYNLPSLSYAEKLMPCKANEAYNSILCNNQLMCLDLSAGKSISTNPSGTSDLAVDLSYHPDMQKFCNKGIAGENATGGQFISNQSESELYWSNPTLVTLHGENKPTLSYIQSGQTHTQPHVQPHTQTHAKPHIQTHAQPHMQPMHSHTQSEMQTHLQSYVQLNSQPHIPAKTQTSIRSHEQLHIKSHTQPHIQSHLQPHTQPQNQPQFQYIINGQLVSCAQLPQHSIYQVKKEDASMPVENVGVSSKISMEKVDAVSNWLKHGCELGSKHDADKVEVKEEARKVNIQDQDKNGRRVGEDGNSMMRQPLAVKKSNKIKRYTDPLMDKDRAEIEKKMSSGEVDGGVESERYNKRASLPQTSASSVLESTPFKCDKRRVRVFVTYSVDSNKHLKLVMNVCKCLKKNEFSVSLDVRESPLVACDRIGWIEQRLKVVDYVLVLVSPQYWRDVTITEQDVAKSSTCPSDSSLNALYIHRLMQTEYRNNQCTNSRFIPVIMPGASKKHIPNWLQNTIPYLWPQQYQDLLFFMTRPTRIMREYADSKNNNNKDKQEIVVPRN